MLDGLEFAMKNRFRRELLTDLSTERRGMFGVENRVGFGLAAMRIFDLDTELR